MNPINFQPNSNIRKLQQHQQQQQILLKYKLKQNEINRIQNQLRKQQQNIPLPENNANITINTNNDVNNDTTNDTTNNNYNENSQKLVAIKSKIMSDYSNLYKTK